PRPMPDAAPVTSAVSPASNSISPLPNRPSARSTFRSRKIIHVSSNNQAPPATKTQPAIRETNLPNGNAFSNKTNPASAAIHNTFMTPTTNSSSIRAQQQPMQ